MVQTSSPEEVANESFKGHRRSIPIGNAHHLSKPRQGQRLRTERRKSLPILLVHSFGPGSDIRKDLLELIHLGVNLLQLGDPPFEGSLLVCVPFNSFPKAL